MLLNIIGFYISWFGLVLLGNSFIPIALLLLCIHLYYLSDVSDETLLILCITFIGIVVDSLLQLFNVFSFSGSHIPFWLMVLWASFAATISHSLKVLASSRRFQFLVGGIVAPLSYLAGYKLKVIDFNQSLFVTYIVLGIIWANLFVLFFYLQSIIYKKDKHHV
ncbi:DUF2878 domain-containing protein [Thalassotalea piscium]